MNKLKGEIKTGTIIDAARTVVAEHSAMMIRQQHGQTRIYDYKPSQQGNNTNRWRILDATTANAIVTLYDALAGQMTKAKKVVIDGIETIQPPQDAQDFYLNLPLERLITFTWRCFRR